MERKSVTQRAVERGVTVIRDRIKTLEERVKAIQEKPSVVFTTRHFFLYVTLLVGEYSNLYFLLQQQDQEHSELQNIMDSTWKVLEYSVTLVDELPTNDVLRLMVMYEYCCFLSIYSKAPVEARNLASKTFEEASNVDNELCLEQLEVLEKIRQDLLVSPRPPALFSRGEEDSEEDDNHEAIDEAAMKITRKRSVKFADLDKLREGKTLEISSGGYLEVAHAIKKTLAQSGGPVYLESIPSASIIGKALDKVFRAYIRGNALPGQLSSGNTVDLAGNTVSFGNFVLNGPYMSWKGFVQLLIDFGIASMPSQKSKIGKKFWQTMSSYNLRADSGLSEEAAGLAPLVTLKEAALIFIQASGSAVPLFLSRKASRKTNTNYNDGEDGPEHVEAESWRLTQSWAANESPSEWAIDVGTNFNQFMDCIGKLGIVGYSKTNFAEIMPTATEKIQHFLSAFLGLTDQRKWFMKVQRKLKSANSAIKEVAERAKSPTATKR